MDVLDHDDQRLIRRRSLEHVGERLERAQPLAVARSGVGKLGEEAAKGRRARPGPLDDGVVSSLGSQIAECADDRCAREAVTAEWYALALDDPGVAELPGGNASTNVVLPTPASPPMSTVAVRPARARSHTSLSSAS